MTRMMKISLIFGVFLGGLPTLAMTGCSGSSASSESIATIDGMSPGEYRDKVQREHQKATKSAKRARRR